MQYHQYLEYLHPTVWEGNLLSMKAFLMTQVGCLGCFGAAAAAAAAAAPLVALLAAMLAACGSSNEADSKQYAELVEQDGLRQQCRVPEQHSLSNTQPEPAAVINTIGESLQCARQAGIGPW
jgi:hypothetical protein